MLQQGEMIERKCGKSSSNGNVVCAASGNVH